MDTKRLGYFDLMIKDVKRTIKNPTSEKIAKAVGISIKDLENLQNDKTPSIKTVNKFYEYFVKQTKQTDPRILRETKTTFQFIRMAHRPGKELLESGSKLLKYQDTNVINFYKLTMKRLNRKKS